MLAAESLRAAVPGTGTIYVDADLSILRRRALGKGFREDLTILNHKAAPVDLSVRIDIASDFADLFEVKDALTKKGQRYQQVDQEQHALVLGYRREQFVRQTSVTSTAPAIFDEQGVSFSVHLEPQGEWTTSLDVTINVLTILDTTPQNTQISTPVHDRPPMAQDLEHWLVSAPRLSCEWGWLERIYKRSLIDLAALRFYPHIVPGKSLPAAGLPWFMAIFGRDSIITSLQALPFVPELAKSTLLTLAAWQGTMVDDFRDEEPGKILHELRYGEMTRLRSARILPITHEARNELLMSLSRWKRLKASLIWGLHA